MCFISVTSCHTFFVSMESWGRIRDHNSTYRRRQAAHNGYATLRGLSQSVPSVEQRHLWSRRRPLWQRRRTVRSVKAIWKPVRDVRWYHMMQSDYFGKRGILWFRARVMWYNQQERKLKHYYTNHQAPASWFFQILSITYSSPIWMMSKRSNADFAAINAKIPPREGRLEKADKAIQLLLLSGQRQRSAWSTGSRHHGGHHKSGA